MGMIVQHNMNALNAYNKLNTNVAGLKKSSEKLASGYRINRAGDDAAGLAISEKMRSQIKGLNQAVRNSQDGINMIQTYEGAAQESHNILRRMKELASEAANGTYQNEVDRDAVQLEFDQLNDELNQIADTDFNGVVMLNGGVMADGLKQVDGKFDYKNYVRDPKYLVADDINKVDYQLLDDKDVAHGSTKADSMWNDLNASWDRKDPTKQKGPDSIDFTFEYDKTNKKWTCVGATNGADKDLIVVEAGVSAGGKNTGVTDADHTENGGFCFGTANSGAAVDVILDGTELQNGDKIVVTVNNPYAPKYGNTNAGAEMVDSTGFKVGANANATTLAGANLKVTMTNASVKDAEMTAAKDSVLSALDGATVKFTYGAENAGGDTDFKNISITLSDGTLVPTATAADDVFKLTLKDGTVCGAKIAGNGSVKIGLLNDTGDDIGTEIAQLTPTQQADMSTAKNGSSGTITYKLAVDAYSYDDSSRPNAVVKDVNTAVSKSNSYTQASAPLTYTDHLILQTGARTKDSVDFTMKYTTDGMGDLKANLDISAREGGLNTANLSLNTQEDANYAIDRIDNAINKVSMVRATFGATQNRLEHKIDNLTTTAENLTEAEASIRDTDMASEMMNYTKFNILQQAAQSMLAQANQQPQSILQLLG